MNPNQSFRLQKVIHCQVAYIKNQIEIEKCSSQTSMTPCLESNLEYAKNSDKCLFHQKKFTDTKESITKLVF